MIFRHFGLLYIVHPEYPLSTAQNAYSGILKGVKDRAIRAIGVQRTRPSLTTLLRRVLCDPPPVARIEQVSAAGVRSVIGHRVADARFGY
jgi:hypothetical protein